MNRSAWFFIGAAIAISFRALGAEATRPFLDEPFASLVFVPGKDTIAVGVLAAFAILWMRRARIAALPPRPAPRLALTAALGATLVLGWSAWTRTPDLSILSLALLCAVCVANRFGRVGVHSIATPLLLLFLTLPIPSPLESEIVWGFQKLTASLVAGCMDAFGIDAVREGVQIKRNAIALEVTESASGLRLIQILVPFAFLLGEIFNHRGNRLFALGLAAAGIGFSANAARILCLGISATRAGNPASTHLTAHAVILLAASVVLLTGVAILTREKFDPPSGESNSNPANDPEAKSQDWLPSSPLLPIAFASLLCVVSVSIPSALAVTPPARRVDTLPLKHEPWSGTEKRRNYTFPYSDSRPAVISRDYAHTKPNSGGGRAVIEVFVAFESRGLGGLDRIPASKLRLPDSDWQPQHRTRPRTDLLDSRIEVTEMTRDRGHAQALVYSWRVRDRGLWLETLRDCWGLGRIRLGDAKPPAVIRIAVPLASQMRSDRRRATERLDAFITHFREPLEDL